MFGVSEVLKFVSYINKLLVKNGQGPYDIIYRVVMENISENFCFPRSWQFIHLFFYQFYQYHFQVFAIAIITALLAYPNEYTRQPTSRVISYLFQNCGPEDGSQLW